MDPARRRANGLSDVLQKRDDVVVRSLFNFQDFGNRKSRSLPNFSSVLFRDLAKLSHRLAGQHFDLQPNLKLAFVRPDLAHRWPGITVNHSGNMQASGLSEKAFVNTDLSRVLVNRTLDRPLSLAQVLPPTDCAAHDPLSNRT